MTREEEKQILDYIEYHKTNQNVLEEETKTHIAMAYKRGILSALGYLCETAFSGIKLLVVGSESVTGFRETYTTECTREVFFKRKLHMDENGDQYFRNVNNTKVFINEFMRCQ